MHSNVELFRRLAKTMGFTDAYWDMTTTRCSWSSTIGARRNSRDHARPAQGRGYMRLNVGDPDKRAPHANGNFKTPSGKVRVQIERGRERQFRRSVWRSMYEGMQPASRSIRCPTISRLTNPASPSGPCEALPLSIVSPKPHAFLNTQYGNEQRSAFAGRTEGADPSKDADERDIQSGSLVRVSMIAVHSKGWPS